jgi:hypothetical protein
MKPFVAEKAVLLVSDKSKPSQHRQIAVSSIETKVICMFDRHADDASRIAGCLLEARPLVVVKTGPTV